MNNIPKHAHTMAGESFPCVQYLREACDLWDFTITMETYYTVVHLVKMKYGRKREYFSILFSFT